MERGGASGVGEGTMEGGVVTELMLPPVRDKPIVDRSFFLEQASMVAGSITGLFPRFVRDNLEQDRGFGPELGIASEDEGAPTPQPPA